ncbi:MAG: MATE family efflux transporter, partial [Oscillospiraceae bacterium]
RLLSLGSMSHVAAWSVVQRIYTFTMMPIVGITQGVQSIIAYFSGNGAYEKIKEVSKRTVVLCSGYGFVGMVLMMTFGQNLASVFGGGQEIATIASGMLFIVFLGFPLVGVLYTYVTLLQVTEQEFASVLLILSRQVFFLIPLIYIVPGIAQGVNIGVSPIVALFFCMPIADFLSVIFGIFVKKRIDNKAAKKPCD